MPADTKTCSKCGEVKPVEGFKVRNRSKDGRRSECRKCAWATEAIRRSRPEVRLRVLEQQRARRKRNYDPVKSRDRNLRSKHKITLAEYEARLEKQGGVCAICGSDGNGKPLAVDHSHSCCPSRQNCGKCLRGLLCAPCNKGLGHFVDSIENLASAIKYLEKWNG